MSSKKAGKAVQKKSLPSVPGRASSSFAIGNKTAWSADGTYYARLARAADCDTVRIYTAAKTGGPGRCVARWASTDAKVQSLVWLELPAHAAAESVQRSNKRRKRDTEDVREPAPASSAPQTALALGMEDGIVLVLHPTTSAALCKLEDTSGMASALTAMAFPPPIDGRSLLWSLDADGTIRAYDLSIPSGKLYGRAQGAGSDHKCALSVRYISNTTAQVLVSSFDIRAFTVSLEPTTSLDLPQSAASFSSTGHTSEVNALRWIDQEGAFASTAVGDRTINLWRSNGELGALLTLDDPPKSLDIRQELLVAVTQTGMAAVYVVPPSLRTANVKRQRVATVQIATRVGTGISDAKLEANAQLCCVRGAELKPVFESIALRDEAGQPIAEITLGAISANLLLDEDGDVNMGAPLQRVAYQEKTATAGTTLTADASEIRDGNEGELDVDMAGPTLAERMKSLKIPLPPEMDDQVDGKEVPALVPQATLAQTLIQALRSDDRDLIEACLAHTSPKLIRATVKRLPTSLVLPLIDTLVDRLSRGKRGYGAGAQRGKALVVWLRTCLVVHVGYLVTVEGLVDRLAAFHAALQHRLEAHNQLLGLAGRLELVVSQIELRREAAGQPRVDAAYEASLLKTDKLSATRIAQTTPIRKYVEGESGTSSDEEDDSDDDEWGGMDIDARQVDPDEVDDIAMTALNDGDDDDDDSEDDSESEDATPVGAPTNGFLDLEADTLSSEEGSFESETGSGESESPDDLDDVDDSAEE